MATSIKRQYTDLAGVDFKNDESLVNLNRSPDSLNVYKNYTAEGNCIQMRPGYSKLGDFGEEINGLYIYNSTNAIVHAGNKLYLWNNFPSNPDDPEILSTTMNDVKTSFFIFEDKLYINDGLNYLVYDGTLKNVSQNAFIPTTTISRKPSGGGEMYQDVNVLQPKRINTFVADGKSSEYYLDTTEITSVDEVYVNDTLTTDYTVSLLLGRITFNNIPEAPALKGVDNVRIVFSKFVSGYTDRISNCTISQVFDNRVFFTGNPNFPNAIFHCELENPAYISDLSYYQDGTSESKIKSITVGNNILWVFKEPNQENATVFYHIPTTSGEYGRIYPTKQGNVSTGCYSTSVNFSDDIVFLRKIVKGGADKSYGIQVARLAGVPDSVIERAKEIASSLADSDLALNTEKIDNISHNDSYGFEGEPEQLSLFDLGFENPVLNEIRNLDLNNMTPMDALNKLLELKKKL